MSKIKVGQIWKGTELCDFGEVVILSNINNEDFSIYFMDRAGYTYSRSAQYIRKRLTYIGESCAAIEDLFKVKGVNNMNKNKSKKHKSERKRLEAYCFLCDDGIYTTNADDEGSYEDDFRYSIGNYFEIDGTDRYTDKYKHRLIAEQKLRDMCDWDNEPKIFYPYYDRTTKEFSVSSEDNISHVYKFSTIESCKRAIDELGDDLYLIFGIKKLRSK